jgi:hypothetical protein
VASERVEDGGMATEMEERVARALCKRRAAIEFTPEEFIIDHLGRRVQYWSLWTEDARAAIEAIREPTEAMERAGQEEELSGTEDVKAIYRAMIDAALKE